MVCRKKAFIGDALKAVKLLAGMNHHLANVLSKAPRIDFKAYAVYMLTT